MAPYPSIAPVLEGTLRPFWSVMIPTYNCAAYLPQTLESVLAQDPGPLGMQIEVVDDGSTRDDPEAVVRALGNGRVAFYRQPENVGATQNFTTCIRRAKGYCVHILHGDDYVVPGFYRAMRAAFQNPEVGAAFCRFIKVDEEGNRLSLAPLERDTAGVPEDWLERLAIRQRIQFPAIVVRRSIYEQLGGFHPELIHAADWEMWKRIAARADFWYDPRPLACYRIHTASDTSRLTVSGQDVADIRKSIEISRPFLPVDKADVLSRKAREAYACRAAQRARRLFALGNTTGAYNQLREGLQCSRSARFLTLCCKALATQLQHSLKAARMHSMA